MPPASDGNEEKTRHLTRCCRLTKVVPDRAHMAIFREVARRMQHILIDATELMTLSLAASLEHHAEKGTTWAEELLLPMQDLYKHAMMLVTEGKGKLKSTNEQMLECRRRHMPSLKPTSRIGLDQLMMNHAISLAATFETNLKTHLYKRVRNYVRHCFPSPEDKKKRAQHALRVGKIVTDVTAWTTESTPQHSDEGDHEWVRSARRDLGFSEWTNEGPSRQRRERELRILIHATWRLNRARMEEETSSAKGCAVCPFRRHLTPGFCRFDTVAMRQVLSMARADYERERARLGAKRREQLERWRQRNRELREAAGLPQPESATRRKRLRVDALTDEDGERLVEEMQPHLERVVCIQLWCREWLAREHERKREASERLAAMKDESWSSILHWRGAVQVPASATFANVLSTDGVSARLLFQKPKPGNNAKRKSSATMPPVPTRGLFTIDQIKQFSRIREAQFIGADPGKRELLVCVDADDTSASEAYGRRGDMCMPSTRYTSAQRRFECLVRQHADEDLRRRPERLRERLEELTKTNSRSFCTSDLAHYFATRRSLLDEALHCFQPLWRRERRWQRFIRQQKSFTDFAQRIRKMRDRSSDRPFVIAYGSWGGIAGVPGQPCNRGHPPCLGKGLRARLASEFVVVSVPERNTSKTCSICGSECGPCEEVDALRRAERMAKATSEESLNKAKRYSVRGLRRCCNEFCSAHLNRDYNAAVNIQRRCKSLILGHLTSFSPEEEELEAMSWMMERGAE